VSFQNKLGGAGIERTEDRGERGLAAPIFRVNKRKLRERELGACIYRVELAYISQQLDTFEQSGVPPRSHRVSSGNHSVNLVGLPRGPDPAFRRNPGV
jgi:hypothetical protein